MTRRQKPKRNKPYRPCWNGDGVKLRAQPWKVDAVFCPVYAIIDQLEQDGTVDVAPNGAPVRKLTDAEKAGDEQAWIDACKTAGYFGIQGSPWLRYSDQTQAFKSGWDSHAAIAAEEKP